MLVQEGTHSDKYRIELDGLRGFAVLGAVLFHIDEHQIPGIFVVMSMFFVLSGYLISKSINTKYEKGEFSFQKFYSNRISRVIPTFYLVVIVSLIVGCLLMLPQHLYELANSSISALTFRINQYLSGSYHYFYKTNHTRPFFHLWSLSIEEQFYIFFPAVFLLLSKLLSKKRSIVMIILIMAAFSFIYAEYSNRQTPLSTTSYYFFFARLGELLLGCFLGMNEKKILENKFIKIRFLSDIGFILILIAFFTLDSSSIFPGFNSFWPSLATIFLILGMNHPKSLLKKFFSLKPLVYAGLASYSLYLWHFPILAFSRYMLIGDNNSFVVNALVLLFIFIVTHLSWKFFETPLRFQKRSFKTNVFIVWFVPGVFLILLSQLIMTSGGWKARAKDFPQELVSDVDLCSDTITGDCLVNNPITPTKKMILFGDSNAYHYIFFWREIAQRYDVKLLAVNAGDCFPSLNKGSDLKVYGVDGEASCEPAHNYVSKIVADYDIIILSAAWMNYLKKESADKITKDFNETLKALELSGKKVLVMEEIAKYSNYEIQHYLASRYAVIPLPWSLDFIKERIDIKKAQAEVAFSNDWLKKQIQPYQNTTYVDLSDLSSVFRALPFYKNETLYSDGKHLSRTGAKLIGEDVVKNNWVKVESMLAL